MSPNRRKVPFRYRLLQPFICEFKIIRINNRVIALDKNAQVSIADVSKSGCRVISDLDLNTHSNQVDVKISLDIVNDPQPISIVGTVKWQSNKSNVNYYGIKFEEGDNDKVMTVLKSFAASNRIKLI
jgi:hypothetical protein